MKHLLSKVTGIFVSIGMILSFVPGVTVMALETDPDVQDVIDQIDSIPAIEDINTDNVLPFYYAAAAYEDLTPEQKEQVTNYDKLSATSDYLETSFTHALDVYYDIEDLGEPEYNSDYFMKLDAARRAYEELTGFEQSLVSNYNTLVEYQAAYDQMAVDVFTEAVSKLPDVDDLDINDEADMDAIMVAMDALDDLNSTQEALVDKDVMAKYYSVLYGAMDQLLQGYIDVANDILDKYAGILDADICQDLKDSIAACETLMTKEDRTQDDYYDPASDLFDALGMADDILENIYTVSEGQDSTWKQGSTSGLEFRIVQEGVIDDAYEFFEKAGKVVTLDGEAVDPENYTYEKGSLIITLKPEYLKTLSTGSHTLTVNFQYDETVNLKFTIESASAVPATGESVSSAAIAGVVIILLAGVALGASRKIKSEES